MLQSLFLPEVQGSGLGKEVTGLMDSPSPYEILETGRDGVTLRVA